MDSPSSKLVTQSELQRFEHIAAVQLILMQPKIPGILVVFGIPWKNEEPVQTSF
jgi:hypothetical protein